MSALKVRATNFRVIERLEWQPEGVCLLAGPNGAGKTTTLDTLKFLRILFERGHESALNAVGGDYFRRLGSPEEELVTFAVEVEDILWKVRFPMSQAGLKGTYGEELYRDGKPILRAALFEDGWYLGQNRMPLDEKRCCARVLWDRGEDSWMAPLFTALTGIRVYGAFWLNQVQRPEVAEMHASFLHATGKNLWSVLANWKNAPLRYRGQFDWVLSRARAAFPDVLDTLEFDRGQPFLFRVGATDPADGLPPRRAADGLLTGLLHLTAVAGAKEGSLLAFDEIENQLHPHAIRVIMKAMREAAEERGLAIILTTHSPVVMNEFKGYEDNFFVLDASSTEPQPRPLLQVRDEHWLSHFALGDLYEREAFAPQMVKPLAVS